MKLWLRKQKARLQREYLVYRYAFAHPRVSRLGRFWIGLAAAYLVSPVDLIPDCLPVVGWLDDVIVVVFLLFLARCAIPAEVMMAARRRAESERIL